MPRSAKFPSPSRPRKVWVKTASARVIFVGTVQVVIAQASLIRLFHLLVALFATHLLRQPQVGKHAEASDMGTTYCERARQLPAHVEESSTGVCHLNRHCSGFATVPCSGTRCVCVCAFGVFPPSKSRRFRSCQCARSSNPLLDGNMPRHCFLASFNI